MTTRTKKALVLLSSGLDSSIALALANEKFDVTLALTFDYGQRAAQCEIAAAAKIAAHFGITHRTLILPWFSEFGKSALLRNNARLPRPTLKKLNDSDYVQKSASAVWVPNRNGVFIECAAAFAEDEGIDYIVVGFNKEEAETFPDNSEEYLSAINGALKFSTKNGVQVISPTAKLDKNEIVKEAKRLKFPFPLLWSCYEGQAKMCGTCESCVRLKRALKTNEVEFSGLFENTSL